MAESTNTDSFLGPRLREGAFIGVSAVCLYLLLALMTYSPRDPGWSATGSGAKISNLGAPPAPGWPTCFSPWWAMRPTCFP